MLVRELLILIIVYNNTDIGNKNQINVLTLLTFYRFFQTFSFFFKLNTLNQLTLYFNLKNARQNYYNNVEGSLVKARLVKILSIHQSNFFTAQLWSNTILVWPPNWGTPPQQKIIIKSKKIIIKSIKINYKQIDTN